MINHFKSSISGHKATGMPLIKLIDFGSIEQIQSDKIKAVKPKNVKDIKHLNYCPPEYI